MSYDNMIGYITGVYLEKIKDKIIVQTASGIGYLVTVRNDQRLELNDNISLFVFDVTRDGASELYGFETLEERLWVERLISVDSVGPKTATNILYTLGVDMLTRSIDEKDDLLISKVKGVSSKTAKKIILELGDKNIDIKELSASKNSTNKHVFDSKIESDYTDTMLALGFVKISIIESVKKLKLAGLWNEDNLNTTVKNGLKNIK